MNNIHVSIDFGVGTSADQNVANRISSENAAFAAGRTICGLDRATLPVEQVALWSVAADSVRQLAREGKLCPACVEQGRRDYHLDI